MPSACRTIPAHAPPPIDVFRTLRGQAAEEHFEAERQAFGPLLVAAIGPLLAAHDLPGIDGIELCRRLRAEPGTRGLPLLALSANAMEADIRRARQAGFDLYRTKPIDVPTLLAEIDRALERSQPSACDPSEILS